MAVSNAQLRDSIEKLTEAVAPIPVAIARLEEQIVNIQDKVHEHDRVLNGNGTPGLVKDMVQVKTWGRVPAYLLALMVAVITVVQALTGCSIVHYARNEATEVAAIETALPMATVPMSRLSPPQQTAIALNSTYVASASHPPTDVPAPVPDATSAPTPTPTPTPTPWVIEVTPNPTPGGPVEVGTINCWPEPGEICKEKGVFTPKGANRVRDCADLSCEWKTSLSAGVPVTTQGFTRNGLDELWVCLEVGDDGRAQTCDRAVAWWFSNAVYGKYEVVP